MKVFIHYQPKHNRATYSAVRVRKTLKGECEVASIPWVDNVKADVDLAHFISPRDLPLLRKMKKRGVKCIVSAFYCENDPNASYIAQNPSQNPTISKEGLAILQEADLVLVPNDFIKDFVIGNGVTSRVEVLSPAVVLSRFEAYPGEEMIFPRYYGVRPTQIVVVATGSLKNKVAIERFTKIASLRPEIEFYYFCAGGWSLSTWATLRRLNKKSTKNCHYVPAAQDDIYRSALYRSIARLSLTDPGQESLGVLDAFAAKLQVIAYGERPFSQWIKKDVTAKVFDTEEEIASYLEDLYQGRAEVTIMGGYQIAVDRRIENVAVQLKAYYESLMNS